MPHHRRTLVLASVLLTVLATALWLGSVVCSIYYVHAAGRTLELHVGVWSGCAGFDYFDPSTTGAYGPTPRGWNIAIRQGPMQWWPDWNWVSSGSGTFLGRLLLPLWILGSPVVGVVAWLWLAKRHCATAACRTCGYDLRGLPAGAVCPECASRQSRATPIERRT